MSGGAASRRKGASHEREIVRWLQARGRAALHRTLFAGPFDRGDIAGWPGVVVEAKNCVRIDLAGWVDQLEATIARCGAETGVVVAKRKGTTDPAEFYAVMTLARWEALMKEAGR
jgi:hypothetical protein